MGVMVVGGVVALCVGSAVIGRLALTRDQAWRTLTVRLPALLQLVVLSACSLISWLIFGAFCFIGGAFYGIGKWWWPQLLENFEGDGEFLCAIITGRWNE